MTLKPASGWRREMMKNAAEGEHADVVKIPVKKNNRLFIV
jgi:hypothetical protein